jgi:hypothetical protein
MHRASDRPPAPLATFPHHGHMKIRASAVTFGLAMRADCPVADHTAAPGFLRCWHNGIIGL